jgi:hypothetical protein
VVQLHRELGAPLGQDRDGVDDVGEAVERGERSRVGEAERAVGHERAARVGAGVEAGQHRPVPDHAELPLRDAERDVPLVARLVHREDPVGDRRRDSLDDRQGADGDRVRRPGPARPEELGRRLVEVQQQRDPGQAEGQRREGEEVGRRVNLDECVAAAPVGAGQSERGPDEEGRVLRKVRRDRRTLVALDVEAGDPDSLERPLGRVAGAAEREDVDSSAGGHEGLGLAADARILLVVAVDQHRDRPAAGRSAAVRGDRHGAFGGDRHVAFPASRS